MSVLSQGKPLLVFLTKSNDNTRLIHSSAFIVLYIVSSKLLIYKKTHFFQSRFFIQANEDVDFAPAAKDISINVYAVISKFSQRIV